MMSSSSVQPFLSSLLPVTPSQCSFCRRAGRVRCSVCKEWYCTALCQANHWPVHRRECVQPPVLEWPDGSRYDGQLEELGREENVTMTSTSMSQMVQEESVKEKHLSGIDSMPAPILPTKQSSPSHSSPLPTKQSAVADNSPFEKKEAAKSPSPGNPKQSSNPAASPITTRPSAPTKPPVFEASSDTAKKEAVAPPVPSNTKLFSPAASPATAVTPGLTVPTVPRYTPAHLSPTLPPQVSPSPGQLYQIVLPVEDISSPSQFGIRLTRDDSSLLQLLEAMNESPPPSLPGWVVGRRETVAVNYEDVWYRGMAVKKMDSMYSVYILDFGGLVSVAPNQMRPLPAFLEGFPAFMYQVCLAGV